MQAPVTSPRRPVHATARQSIAATTYFGVLPTALGWFASRPAGAAAARRADATLQTILLCDRLRRDHGGAPVWLRVGGRPLLLVIHREDVRAALDGTPAPFTIEPRPQSGRRRNTAVATTSHRQWRAVIDSAMHVAAGDSRTAKIAAAQALAVLDAGNGRIEAVEWRRAHHRVLDQVMRIHSGADYRARGGTAATARAHLLAGVADTLADNTFRTLQLLSVRPPACGGRMYLTACLREAARLWPASSGVVRDTTRDTVWGGRAVRCGTRLLVVNSFGHRDRRRVAFADEFMPGEWLAGGHALREPLFNGFGHVRRTDPGQALALACGGAMLSTVMERVGLRPVDGVLDGDGRVRYCPPAPATVRLGGLCGGRGPVIETVGGQRVRNR